MQREIKKPVRLLNENGELAEIGYARKPIFEYRRKDIKASPWRIKEWDYYLITNDDYAVALTIADNSYIGFLSASLIDFKQKWYKTTSVIKPLTFGKLNLPSSSTQGDIVYKDHRVEMAFFKKGKDRHLECTMKNLDRKKDFHCEFLLSDEPRDSMVIAIPFPDKKNAFYYNRKINCLTARGKVYFGEKEYEFLPDRSFGTFDWGRGVWTYKNTWYWGSASGIINGKKFGFNIGYGFGDTSKATENMVFYDGIAHKLDQVTFHIPKKDENGKNFAYMKPWTFSSNDGRFEMDFEPIIDRNDSISVGVIASDQHQVFGYFTGKAVLNDGKVIEVKNLLGFAERVVNRW
ncbi:DUF2804 domain-containing protein [Fervidibacillus halotolerans]|uniref:DUF2804 domain-containing protein n=1 Tax=Fervidibacillus halotolerans TaxID=2980027 RepID=A0A9E8M0W0_9BACI|nr:DUF2804 domain-containing protein [Fervidibacillus halotolerans]WAA12922.1 DUF2804 domain-containing protein [Fervidibacillus halotolerans]